MWRIGAGHFRQEEELVLRPQGWYNLRTLLCTEFLCVPPPKLICWNLIHNVMVFRGRVFQGWVDHEGGAFMNGISALRRDQTASSLALSLLCEDRMRRQPLVNQIEGFHWNLTIPQSDLRLPASITMRNKYMFFKSPSLWSLLQQPKLIRCTSRSKWKVSTRVQWLRR